MPNIHVRDIEIPLDVDVVISVAGARRSGKTFLVYSLISKLKGFLPKSNILFINLEHERLRPLSVEDIDDLNTANNEIGKPDGTKPIYFFMDKIQAMEGGADR